MQPVSMCHFFTKYLSMFAQIYFCFLFSLIYKPICKQSYIEIHKKFKDGGLWDFLSRLPIKKIFSLHILFLRKLNILKSYFCCCDSYISNWKLRLFWCNIHAHYMDRLGFTRYIHIKQKRLLKFLKYVWVYNVHILMEELRKKFSCWLRNSISICPFYII